jgi:hypothetical protein
VELKITTFQDEPMTFEEALMKRALNIINKMQLDHDKAQDNLMKSQDKQKARHKSTKGKINIGDKVLLHRTDLQNNLSAKLNEKWVGPFYVHNVLPNNVYKLRNLDGKLIKSVVHGNRLKLYHETPLEPIIIIDDGKRH